MLPILYQNRDLILYAYPLLMGIGWGVAYQIFFSLLEADFPRWKGQIIFWGTFLFAWIGAKLFFILTNSGDSDYVGQLSFWFGGGFVFYGGFIAGFVFLLLYRAVDKSFKMSSLWPVLPALSIGHGIGRLGCFLAGCCFGRPTDWFWGVYLHGHNRHPTQLIESLGLLALGVYLVRSQKPRSFLVAIYLVTYGLLRLLTEGLRGDAIRGQWGPLTPSQWISVVLVVAGVVIISSRKSKA